MTACNRNYAYHAQSFLIPIMPKIIDSDFIFMVAHIGYCVIYHYINASYYQIQEDLSLSLKKAQRIKKFKANIAADKKGT